MIFNKYKFLFKRRLQQIINNTATAEHGIKICEKPNPIWFIMTGENSEIINTIGISGFRDSLFNNIITNSANKNTAEIPVNNLAYDIDNPVASQIACIIVCTGGNPPYGIEYCNTGDRFVTIREKKSPFKKRVKVISLP
jgi:hypothetical protein